MEENKVIFYSIHCPKCKVLETKLKEKNIKYKEVNDIDYMISLDIYSSPVLEVNGERMEFFEACKWVNEQ